jgi:hypothetical protein
MHPNAKQAEQQHSNSKQEQPAHLATALDALSQG